MWKQLAYFKKRNNYHITDSKMTKMYSSVLINKLYNNRYYLLHSNLIHNQIASTLYTIHKQVILKNGLSLWEHEYQAAYNKH